jgi:murein endopeptidase
VSHGKRVVDALSMVTDGNFKVRPKPDAAFITGPRHVPARATAAGNGCMAGAQTAPTIGSGRQLVRRESARRSFPRFANPPSSDTDLDAFLTDACVISC